MLKLAYAGLALVLCGCASTQPGRSPKEYRMGEPVQTGSLVYTVLDTQWLDQLAANPMPRLPRDHFLSVRVSVVNNGPTSAGVPPMSIVDNRGVSYPELENGVGLPEWLGSLRIVKPAETLHGQVLFDVPTGPYTLQLSDDAESENRKRATVELPLELTRPQIRTDLPAGR